MEIGPFKQILPKFFKYEKSLGHKYNNTNNYFLIDKILQKNKIYDLSDTKKIYEVLIKKEPNESHKIRNYNCLKQLYKYLEILGYTDLYLEEYKSKIKSNFKPTILTHKQLTTFFKTLDIYCKNSKEKEDYIYSIIFRLLYSSGLRISECLSLKITDYSKEKQTIFIYQSKDNVTRELPLSKSMNQILKSYISTKKNNTYLFEINNQKISYQQVSRIFKEVLKKLNFKFRIHDLRHLFSVNTFNNLFKKGYDEYWILFYLHIYLGHKNWHSTVHYLQYTSSHLQKAVNQCSKFYRNVGDENE